LEALLFSVNTIFPLLMLMAAGFGARRLHWLERNTARQITQCVFRLFLPLQLCFFVMDTDRHLPVDGWTLLFGFVGMMAVYGLLFLLVPILCKRREAWGTLVQAIGYSNYGIFGIPLVLSMYPHSDVGVAAMMTLVAVPVTNAMSTLALIHFGSGDVRPWQIIRKIIFNPLIVGTIMGLLLWWLEVTLPPLLDRPLRQLGSIATPVALFALGASLDFGQGKGNIRLLVAGVFGRLVLIPLIGLSAAVILGIRDIALATMIAVLASPIGVSTYAMAQQFGGDEDLAAAMVVFSTAFSVFTIFLWVLLCSSLGFLR